MISIKNFKYIFFIFLYVISIICSRAEENEDVLSQEDISNIILTVKNDATGISQAYNYTLNSATNPDIKLTNGATYTVNAVFKNGNADETESIKSAKDEHFLIYDFQGSQINLTREDDASSTRSDGAKVGLVTKWKVTKVVNSPSPKLILTLIHDATSVNEVQNGTTFGNVVGGETDAMATFGISN
jgi:hypothetical protein